MQALVFFMGTVVNLLQRWGVGKLTSVDILTNY